MAPPTGLKDYLMEEEPEIYSRLRDASDGVDKGMINRKSQLISMLLTEPGEQKIVQTPHQAEELLEEAVDIVVHMGCHAIQTPQVVEATVDVLEAMEYTIVPLGGFNNCCGAIDLTWGDLEAAERVDDQRFRNIEAFDPDYLLTECTSCFAHTEKLSSGYRDMTGYEFLSMVEFLLQRRDELLPLIETSEPVTVALHDHFDATGWTPLREAKLARQLFDSLPGVEVVEMEHSLEDGLPCNFLTDVSQYPYDDITTQIYEEATAAGADYIINFWHACQRHMIQYDPEYPVQAKNYATFLAERMGFSYRDTLKEYKLAAQGGDIDWVIEDSRPVFEANGLSEAKARQIITEQLAPKRF